MFKCQNSGVYFIEISSISKIIVSIDREEEFWSTSNSGSEEMAREEIKLTAITDFIVLQKITGPQKNKTKYFSLRSTVCFNQSGFRNVSAVLGLLTAQRGF